MELKGEIGDWSVYERVTREEEVIINRLRAGHAWLTRLMDVDTGGAVPCTFCSKKNIVNHFNRK